MCEKTIYIDPLLAQLKHGAYEKRRRVKIFIRESLQMEFMEFLAGKSDKKNWSINDISYRFSKLIRIAYVIYDGTYFDSLYRLESSSQRITAMKFMDKGFNDRVYCRELDCTDLDGEYKKVILAYIHRTKKANKVRMKEINIIEKVGSYEFDCEH